MKINVHGALLLWQYDNNEYDNDDDDDDIDDDDDGEPHHSININSKTILSLQK